MVSGNGWLCRSFMVSFSSHGASSRRCQSHLCASSRHGPELPGDELLLAYIELLADGSLARGNGDDALEDLVAHLGEPGRTIDDPTAVDVHVLGHPLVHLGVGRQLDRRCGTAS